MYLCSTSNGAWYENEGQFAGVNLGADASTEHECGTGPIRDAFGIDWKEPGIVGHQIQRLPKSYHKLTYEENEDGSEAALYYGVGSIEGARTSTLMYRSDWSAKRKPGEPRPEKNHAFAWSDEAFAVLARGDEVELVRELHEAFKRKDIAILTTSGFVMTGGLHLLIVSRFPQDKNEEWIERDLKKRAVRKRWAQESEGLEEELRAAGLKWFSFGKMVIERDDGTVAAWLNPWEQGLYNCGYFTVEQYRAWIRGEGPIVKSWS